MTGRLPKITSYGSDQNNEALFSHYLSIVISIHFRESGIDQNLVDEKRAIARTRVLRYRTSVRRYRINVRRYRINVRRYRINERRYHINVRRFWR